MLFNIHTCEWDQDLLDLFDIPASMLPEVMPSDSSFGALEIMNNIEVKAVLGDHTRHCLDNIVSTRAILKDIWYWMLFDGKYRL